MRNNSSEIDAVLQSRPQRVVPAVFLFDESLFAASAEENLRRVRHPDFEKVVLCGPASKGPQVAGQFFTSGFHQSISPLTVMDNVPGWCVWFLDSEKTQLDAFSSQLRALDGERPGRFHHLLFLKTDKPDQVKTWVTGASERLHLPFLLCPHGAMDRSDEELARAAVACVYAGWKKYWEVGDANLAAALSLPYDSRVLTLGMSASELDVVYHAHRWSEKVLEALRVQMLSKTHKPERPGFKGIKELFGFLLPDWYIATPEVGSPRSVAVKMGDDSTTLHYRDRKPRQPNVNLSHRRHFQQLLVRLKDKFCFLAFIALANARRFVRKKAGGLNEEIWPPIREILQLPEKADSLMNVLAGRVKHCADYADEMRETQVAGEPPAGSFQQDYKTAWARISAIPNLLGAFLRLALITIGLSGLILAPFWWGGVRHPLADDLLHNVAIGSAVLLAVCFIGVFIHYYYAWRVADHHFDLTETNIELRHLREICGLAIEEIQKEGNSLKKRMDDLREDLDSLADGIKKASVKPAIVKRSPTGAWLSDNCVDVLMQPRTPELAHKVYERVAEELTTTKNKAGLVDFTPAVWRALMAKHAVLVCAEALGLLTFDQCVAAMGPSPNQKETLIHNLAHESSQPAWPAQSDAGAPIFCFADPTQWREHCGRHDTLTLYQLNLKDMLIVSIIPLREFA